jgi:hypothetical protein
MGNNVMLYLDDIQHTTPSCCRSSSRSATGSARSKASGSRATRTYDLRGKKFCVVMAGNPYTETGEKFRIPDMLANRADTYNLGDILEGKDDVFALSYVENALTSNPRSRRSRARPEGRHKLIRMARASRSPRRSCPTRYSPRSSEIIAVFTRLFRCATCS